MWPINVYQKVILDSRKRKTGFNLNTTGRVGQLDRFHRTINSVLGKIVSNNQRDWDEHVSYALGAYRATKHSATGFLPNYLIFGRELASPFELMFPGIPGIDNIHDQNHGEYVATLKDRFRKAYTLVTENLKAVAFRNKKI